MIRVNKTVGMMDIFETVKGTIEVFRTLHEVEPIRDWQGNEDFSKHTMDVLRDITLKFDVKQYGDNLDLLAEHCGANLPWANDHFEERVSGKPTNPGHTYKYWPFHTNLDESNYKENVFSHTYQERFWPKHAGVNDGQYSHKGIRYNYGDLEDVIKQLNENTLTRQAYLPIWFPEDTGAQGRRVPCTLGYYFYINPISKDIHMIYTIRSCDILRHFRNDVYLTTRLLIYVYDKLKVNNPELKLGTVKMDIYNLHRFTNDRYAFDKIQKSIYGKL